MTNDIALIKLNTYCNPSIETDISARSAQLAYDKINTSYECYILGYGYTRYAGEASEDLQIANIKYITLNECIDKLGRVGAPDENWGMFCAEGHNGVDTCNVIN